MFRRRSLSFALVVALSLFEAAAALYSPSDAVLAVGQANFQKEVYGSPEVVLAEVYPVASLRARKQN